jgi:hypothetical protein
MNIKPLAILAALSFLTTGCNKQAAPPPTPSNAVAQSPPSIQAEPFHGQVYKSIDSRTVLTLVSKDECELNQGGTILLCKYTKPNDTLRVVATALGTSQVLYYRFTDQGLQDNAGNVLFSPEGYTAAIARLESQRKAKQIEEQRVARVAVESKIASKTNATFAVRERPSPVLSGTGGDVILTLRACA